MGRMWGVLALYLQYRSPKCDGLSRAVLQKCCEVARWHHCEVKNQFSIMPMGCSRLEWPPFQMPHRPLCCWQLTRPVFVSRFLPFIRTIVSESCLALCRYFGLGDRLRQFVSLRLRPPAGTLRLICCYSSCWWGRSRLKRFQDVFGGK
jgi:hypothetical protein